MSSHMDERMRAVLERAALMRKPKPRTRSMALEMAFGTSAVLLAFLSLVATYPDATNDVLNRVAVAMVRQPQAGIDMETTASIARRAPTLSLTQESPESLPESIGQGDGPVGARIHIDMSEETLRGSL